MDNFDNQIDNRSIPEQLAQRLELLGYSMRQSPSDDLVWYLTKLDRGYLFALIFEPDGKWRLNDISGNGALEQPRIEREVQAVCN